MIGDSAMEDVKHKFNGFYSVYNELLTNLGTRIVIKTSCGCCTYWYLFMKLTFANNDIKYCMSGKKLKKM